MAAELDRLIARVPEGWSEVSFAGRRYGLTRRTHGEERIVTIYAEELGGIDVVSANIYRLPSGDQLKACEMPDEKVLDFLRSFELAD